MVGHGGFRFGAGKLREKGEAGTASVRIAVVWLVEFKRGEKAGHDGNRWVMD